MRRLVDQQQLGSIATVCSDGMGLATIWREGPEFERALEFYRRRGSTSEKQHVVLVKVEAASPLVSPACDGGRSEAEVTAQWRKYWQTLWGNPTASPLRPR